MDVVAHAESAEKQIDAFIETRSRKEPDPDELEASYVESVRRYNSARREERRVEWCAYHAEQAERIERTAAQLAASHRSAAQKLLEETNGKDLVRLT